MLAKSKKQIALACAMFAAAAISAGSQEFAQENWSKVKDLPGIEYQWKVQTNGDGAHSACVVQVRSSDAGSSHQFVGTVGFIDLAGHAASRPIEVSLHAGHVFTGGVGGSCARVTDLQIAPRTAAH